MADRPTEHRAAHERLSTGALADCTYNGKTYPSGTVIGPYVCSGTQWK